jgi:hypothetical protein
VVLRLRGVLLRLRAQVVPLSEWPTSLSACTVSPLLAVGSADGTAKLVEYRAAPTSEEELAAERAAIGAARSLASVMVLSSADVELHCATVRALSFAGSTLYSAAEDEVVSWQMAEAD